MSKAKDTPKEILGKIKKLWAKSGSEKEIGNPGAAELYALKAQELMAKYNLAMEDVDITDEKPKVTSECIGADEANPKNEGDWILNLYILIASHNFSRAIRQKQSKTEVYKDEYKFMEAERDKHEKWSNEWYRWNGKIRKKFFNRLWDEKDVLGIRIIGEPMNIEMVKFICDQLINRVRIYAKAAYKVYQKEDGPEKKNTFIRGFYAGFVIGLRDKMETQKEKIMLQPAMKSMSMVKYNEVNKWVDDNLSMGRSKSGGRGYSGFNGGEQGYKQGKRTNIREGLNTNDLNQKLIT